MTSPGRSRAGMGSGMATTATVRRVSSGTIFTKDIGYRFVLWIFSKIQNLHMDYKLTNPLWNGTMISTKLAIIVNIILSVTRAMILSVGFNHYNDVIMSAMAYQITGVSVACSNFCSQIKKTTNALRHWPAWGETTGDRRFPITKGQ